MLGSGVESWLGDVAGWDERCWEIQARWVTWMGFGTVLGKAWTVAVTPWELWVYAVLLGTGTGVLVAGIPGFHLCVGKG